MPHLPPRPGSRRRFSPPRRARWLLAASATTLLLATSAGCGAGGPGANTDALAARPLATPALSAATAEPTLAPTQAPTAAALDPTATATLASLASQSYTLQPDDTLQSVADHFHLSVDTLLAVNNLSAPDQAQPGQTLTIPAEDGIVHVVQPGESLRMIAAQYGISLSDVVAANLALTNPDLLSIGTRVFLPGAQEPQPFPTPSAAQQAASEGASTSLQAAGPSAPTRVGDEAQPPVTASYIAIVDGVSGQLLYGQGAHTRVAPASITKIVTTMVALDHTTNLDTPVHVTISGAALEAKDGSSIMGLVPGQTVSLRTLLYGMMLPSGNDAAEQTALTIAGDRDTFVGWMNQKVASLGLQDTHFANPSGMDQNGHYSSAYDMVMLGREAMQDARFRTMAGARSYQGDGFSLETINKLLAADPEADGVKVGQTPEAGKTIVARAIHNGHTVYIGLMDASDLPDDCMALYSWVWRNWSWD